MPSYIAFCHAMLVWHASCKDVIAVRDGPSCMTSAAFNFPIQLVLPMKE